MREIKFRGKHINTVGGGKPIKEWVYGYLIKNKLDWCFMVEDGNINKFIRVIPETVGQYTGLKDKNDKEIYEDDVIREFAECDEYGKNLYYFYKIVWDKEKFSFVAKDIYTNNDTYLDELGDIEIIGNIHNNPELLQEVSHERNN